MSTRLLALLAAAATGIQVGAAIVASRMVIHEVPPLTLALLRYMIGAACLLPFAISAARAVWSAPAHRSDPADRRLRDWLMIGLLGIGQFGGLIALLNIGLKQIDAANAALIFSLLPVLTLLLSAQMGRERVSLALAAGLLFCFAGVALALGPKLATPHAASWWGELAVLGSAALGALCSVLYRPYLKRYPTVLVSCAAMLASVLALMLMALPEDWPRQAGLLGPSTWQVVGFIGLSSGLGYGWWLYALKHLPPTRATVFLSLSPLTAALLGPPMLHEPLGINILGAVALTGAGLWLASRDGTGAPG